MPSVFYSPEAEKDILGIADYIARDKPEAARRWAQRLRQTCQMLAYQPGLVEIIADFGIVDCRSFSFGQYVIFFRPSPTGLSKYLTITTTIITPLPTSTISWITSSFELLLDLLDPLRRYTHSRS